MSKNRNFLLGSGDLYVCELTTEKIPDNATLEIEENRFGYISGGATLSYKAEYTSVRDDLGYVNEQLLKSEDVTFKSGVLHRNMDVVPILIETARQADDLAAGTVTTKIGGLRNLNGKLYVLRFVHRSSANPGYELRATMVGKNINGLELLFQQDKETVTDALFSASPLDSEGTLVYLTEKKPDEEDA